MPQFHYLNLDVQKGKQKEPIDIVEGHCGTFKGGVMAEKYTAGPWKIEGGTNKKGDLFVWMDGDYCGGHGIATVHGEIQEGAKANARLIVAAPDLLEACKYTLRCLQRNEIPIGMIGSETKHILRLAVEKAEGN